MFNNQLVAVWSAPNYCYRCGNIASIMEVDEYLQSTFKVFDAAPQSARQAPSKNPPPDYFLYGLLLLVCSLLFFTLFVRSLTFMTLVLIASTNPCKIDACRKAFTKV